MAASFFRQCGHAGAVWADRLVYSVAGRWAAEGDPAVMQCLGRYVPLSTPWAPHVDDHPPVERSDRLLAWTRSGSLTYGEAELLMAFDESTPWQVQD